MKITHFLQAFEATLKEENHTHQPTLESYEDSTLFFLTYAQVFTSYVPKLQQTVINH